MYRRAQAIGEEARAKGINTQFGPGLNLMRTPQAGRAFECTSNRGVVLTRRQWSRPLSCRRSCSSACHGVCVIIVKRADTQYAESRRHGYDATLYRE